MERPLCPSLPAGWVANPPRQGEQSGLVAHIDELLGALERQLAQLEAFIAARAARAEQGGVDMLQGSVRQKRAVFNMLAPLGQLRDALLSLLAGSGNDNRQELRLACGEDCQRIAHVSAMTEAVAAFTCGSNLAEDARLKGCADACAAVEGVLRDSGLAERLREAKIRAREALQEASPATVALQEAAPEASPASVESSSPSRQPLRIMRTTTFNHVHTHETRMHLFEELDTMENRPAGRNSLTSEIVTQELNVLDKLFDMYDKDGNGLLEGEEYDKVISELSLHVHREAEERGAKYGKKTFVPPLNVIENWVKEVVDPNSDGAITREEARVGIKKVVDDID